MHQVDDKSRVARRQQLRARYRRRRLMAVAVLFGLLVGIWVQTGVWFGSSEADDPTAGTREVGSDDVAPLASRGSLGPEEGFTPAPPEEVKARVSEKTVGPRTDRKGEPAREAQDDSADEGSRKAPTGSLNVLVLGVDRRPSAGEDSSTRSDTMMLVKVTPETGMIKLLSVPRDLFVEVSPGVQNRINSAYATGGVERAKAVMEDLTGVSIDRHAIVDFGGFEDVINALGGITLDVGQPIRVGIEGRRVYIPAGTQELDGLEALAFARYRGTPCGDLDRIERQQKLVAALREQALGWDTVTKLPRVVMVANQNVDTNLGIVQAISLGRMLVGRDGEGGIRSAQLKGTPEVLPNGNAVLVPDDQANEKILEKFRNDDPKVHRPDRGPRPDNSSSEC